MRRKNCFYCTEKIQPSYKEVVGLKRFVTERGKIIPRQKSGVCASHQRRLGNAVKKARHLALLQYAPQI